MPGSWEPLYVVCYRLYHVLKKKNVLKWYAVNEFGKRSETHLLSSFSRKLREWRCLTTLLSLCIKKSWS